MHAIELAVLTARLVDHLTLADGTVDWKAFELETYWSASRIRLDRWTRAIKQLPSAQQWHALQQSTLASEFQALGNLPSPAEAPGDAKPISGASPSSAAANLSTPHATPDATPLTTRGRILKPHGPASPGLGPHFSPAPPLNGPAAQAPKHPFEWQPKKISWSEAELEAIRLLEEILVAEIQCRVFTCLLEQTGGRETTKAAASVTRSVWLGHQEVRCQVLAWIADGVGVGMPLADEVNRMRRRCERWSDLLLAKMGGDLAKNFSVDAGRFAQFSQMEDETVDVVVELEPMVRGSLEQMLGGDGDERAAFPDLNQQIHEAIARTVDGRSSDPSLESLQGQLAHLMSRVQSWIDRCNQD